MNNFVTICFFILRRLQANSLKWSKICTPLICFTMKEREKLATDRPSKNLLATIWKSAYQLNSDLTKYAHEKQVFRIDHYLGKETVQNILMFRFSNSILNKFGTARVSTTCRSPLARNWGRRPRRVYEEAGATP